MSKKIVVITASARVNGNSNRMAEAFIAAAEAKGNSVTRIDAAKLAIKPCRACNSCYKNGEACVFGDDFNTIAPAIEAADDIVFAMPVYWYSIPTSIKAVIDKLYAMVVGGKDIAGKDCAVISCCEEDDMSVFAGVSGPMKLTAALINWNMVGEVLVPGVNDVGDIEKTDGCAQAAALADKF